MQQADVENSGKNILVLIDFRSALLPFGAINPIKPFLQETAKVCFPVISVNHPNYLPLLFLTLLKAGFLELPPDLAPRNKKPAAIIIGPEGEIERIPFLTQDAEDSKEIKQGYSREALKWGNNPDDQFPNIAVLPSSEGFPIPKGFEIAAAEFGYPLHRTIYIAGAYYEGGLRAAHAADVEALSAEPTGHYRPMRPDGKFDTKKSLFEIIKKMTAAVPV